MAIAHRIRSLAEVAELSHDSETFSRARRDFLDGFYEGPTAEKLPEEPRILAGILQDEGYANAYLAAVAEYLARRHELTVPRWSLQPGRRAARPTFGMKTYAGRMFLLLESPAEFRARNIFISADALTRV